MAFRIREAERCPKCYQFGDDWQDPETKRPIQPPPLDIVAWYCESCSQWERKEKDIPDGQLGVRLKFQTPAPVESLGEAPTL